MAKLTFYGGVNEIGGNKVLLEEGMRSLLLDFGFPFKENKLYYEEYLRPRGGAGLLDPLEMDMLPPLEGIYRRDLAFPGMWKRFQNHPLYRKLEGISGVLLSHAHMDHSGYISFLKEDIPVFCTAVTAFIAKANQDCGRATFDQQVCYFSNLAYETPDGWKQPAFINTRIKKQRRFCLPDMDMQSLNPQAVQYWKDGFWQRTRNQTEVICSPLAGHSSCSLRLMCFPVDHSIPGACAWGIETAAGWIIYSGDLRLHGKRSHLTRSFMEQAARLKPKALIMEGTNLRDENSFEKDNVTEQQVYENASRAIMTAKGLVIADFSQRDIDRLLTFLQIAVESGRKLAILPKDAYLLKTVRLMEPQLPDIILDKNVVIYQKTTASKSPDVWQRNIYDDCKYKVVLADDVHAAQDKFILCFSFFDINELPSIRPAEGSLYVFSSSEPHDEEQEIDFRRLHQWLQHFKMETFGLPLEKDGKWQTPEEEKGLHASGHACGKDLLEIVRHINPQTLIPVHSEHPELYIDKLEGSGINIILPENGKTIELS